MKSSPPKPDGIDSESPPPLKFPKRPSSPITEENTSEKEPSWDTKFPTLANLLHYLVMAFIYVAFSLAGMAFILAKAGRGIGIIEAPFIIVAGISLGIYHAYRCSKTDKLHDDDHHGF